VSQLDKKLTLPPELVMLIRHQVHASTSAFSASISPDQSRSRASMNQAKFDALDEYGTSPVFNDAERAALDYVTELTKGQEGQPGDFHPYVAALLRARNLRDRLARRQRASLQHDQHRLNIHSDMLYIVAAPPLNGSSHPKQKAQRSSVSPSRAGQGTGTSSSNTRPTQLKDSLGRSRVSRHCLSTTFD
jgi:hypothetical protein